MIDLHASACINADASRIWKQLTALDEIPLWSHAVLTAACPPGHSEGVGAIRHCTLRGGIRLEEHWVGWDSVGRWFQYEAKGLPMVAHASNRWQVESVDSETSLLRTHAQVRLKGGVFVERMLGGVLRRRSDEMASRALAAFKYLVETGVPYRGRPSDLQPAPATC
ncbi:SRPBCC family protein [Piscinibacter sp. HJYY11]|uniref:SRPBCC family protein n=1 Tax=Piscinibacter sp. HJYY11 TaxID=2801333 RepID=UPI00191E0FE3|nr:SRPBCC family protein [Piscinibacter sp. HJYY11]MBL0726609.1 SRPBCC family protein [Piscinibacter sp. HJYY11]